MQRVPRTDGDDRDLHVVFSASDLNDYTECRALTQLERETLHGSRQRPHADDAALRLLGRKGEEHERRYLDSLRRNGIEVLELPLPSSRSLDAFRSAESEALAAMATGAAYIYQPTFFDGTFLGRADFLRRVEYPSARWSWSYEVVDTKLARSMKAYFLVQLCAYSEHVARLQGNMPKMMHVALGSGEERAFALDTYVAYYHHLKARFLGAPEHDATYPYECTHCTVCRWSPVCDGRRRRDDHLSLVAWMRRDAIDRFERAGIATIAHLATAENDARPRGMNPSTFENLRLQAQLQHAYHTDRRYRYHLLSHQNEGGFALLPQPDDGDIYFDIEGDPYYSSSGGLEYLFGLYLPNENRYVPFWAHSAHEERHAIEQLVDFITQHRTQHPNMHVYHYANYERAALGRLTGRYNTRIEAFDDLLRSETFVDLFTVVRQALRISQESYSIKKLEPFYGMQRGTTLRRGDDSILLFEQWLDDGNTTLLEEIERYNEDDCRSTHLLHHWLLERRMELAARDHLALSWRPAPEIRPTPPAEIAAQSRRHEIATALLAQAETCADSRAVFLGNLIEYHRRESKPAWWEFFFRCDNLDRLVEFDHESLGDLRLCEDVPPVRLDRSFVYTYSFPEQQHHLGSTPSDPLTRKSAGTVVEIDDAKHRLRLKLASSIVPSSLTALIPAPPLATTIIENALTDVGAAALAGRLSAEHPVIVDLLDAALPRFRDRSPGTRIQPEHLDGASLALHIAALDASYLVVQGPPGSGKSTLGGEAIARLVASGARVGILARTHKAAHNLVHAVERAAERLGVLFTGAHKGSDDDAFVSRIDTPRVHAAEKNADALDTRNRLVSGTQWLFASDGARNAFDVLVVDEAGQLALADVVACALSTRSIVLLGDPLQLAQVTRGSHPVGVGVSVLEHLLRGHTTIPEDRGIFLERSWRMHPEICQFISEHVYEGRLHSADGLETNAVRSSGLSGNGLRWIAVEHQHCTRSSIEEADAIVREIQALVGGTCTIYGHGTRSLSVDDILVVSPYNAQRVLLRSRLLDAHLDVRVGTVDKFQGQEAPVVFYSMATSSGDDLPRDMEFLFEKNRFNVALSRAQALSILVCSPQLLDIRCTTPEQMALANLLCAFVASAERHDNTTVPKRFILNTSS